MNIHRTLSHQPDLIILPETCTRSPWLNKPGLIMEPTHNKSTNHILDMVHDPTIMKLVHDMVPQPTIRFQYKVLHLRQLIIFTCWCTWANRNQRQHINGNNSNTIALIRPQVVKTSLLYMVDNKISHCIHHFFPLIMYCTSKYHKYT